MNDYELEFSKNFVAKGNVLITVGGENCGPMYIFYIGSDGKLHVKKVDPRPPEVGLQFDTAVLVMKQALLAKDRKIEEKLLSTAQTILTPIALEVRKQIVGE